MLLKIIILFFILFIATERIWETFFRNKSHSKGIRFKKWTLYALSISYALVLMFSFINVLTTGKAFNLLITIAGAILFIFAFIIRNLSINTLKEYHSIHIEIKQEHKIIKEGIYGYLRHPYYLSIMIEVVSIAMVANSIAALFLAICIYCPLVFLRIYFEEQEIIRRVGQDYLDYKTKVMALLPIYRCKK